MRQKEDEVKRLKSQLERYKGLKGINTHSGQQSFADLEAELNEENVKLQAKVSSMYMFC